MPSFSPKPAQPSYSYLSTSEEHTALVERYDNWLFDCDGVLYRGGLLIPGAAEFLKLLRSKNKNIIFVTNSASSSRAMYKKKFNDMKLDAKEDEIFGSAYAAATYLSRVSPPPKFKPKVFLIGESGLETELRAAGVPFICGTDPTFNIPPPDGDYSKEYDEEVGAVLFGFDGAISYPKLARAFVYLYPSQERKEKMSKRGEQECQFLITNPDPTFPSSNGQDLPGAGSLSATLRYALSNGGQDKTREPVILGKPSKGMWRCIQAAHHLDLDKSIMVGDRLDTDIIFGRENGIGTLLVLSGVTQKEHLRPEAEPLLLPDFVTGSLRDFIQGQE